MRIQIRVISKTDYGPSPWEAAWWLCCPQGMYLHRIGGYACRVGRNSEGYHYLHGSPYNSYREYVKACSRWCSDTGDSHGFDWCYREMRRWANI